MDIFCANMKGTAQSVAISRGISNQGSSFWGNKISGRLINKGFGVRSCKSFRTEERGRKVKSGVAFSVLTRDINKELVVRTVFKFLFHRRVNDPSKED